MNTSQRSIRPPRPGRIVVAEDDADFRRLLVTTLLKDGHEVLEASNGPDLMRCLSHPSLFGPSVDLVISDVCMPGMSGLEALTAIEHADCLPPFIVMTAFRSESAMAQARALGAVAVLDKPFSIKELQRQIAQLLSKN